MMRTLFLLGAILSLTRISIAFNSEDNWDGYSGHCPSGWNGIKHFCYRAQYQYEDFHGALRECTSKADEYYMHWEQGSRWLGPDHNLMPVGLLSSLRNKASHYKGHLGRGPYRFECHRIQKC